MPWHGCQTSILVADKTSSLFISEQMGLAGLGGAMRPLKTWLLVAEASLLVISVCLYMLSAGFHKDALHRPASRRVNNKTASVDFELPRCAKGSAAIQEGSEL
jgi:hypothetical protein